MVQGAQLDALDSVSATPDLRLAEASEWVGSDFSTAVRLYKKLLASAAAPAEQAFLFSRLGRCFFKLGKCREGIREYRRFFRFHMTISHRRKAFLTLLWLSLRSPTVTLCSERTHKQSPFLMNLYQRLLRSPWTCKMEVLLTILSPQLKRLKSVSAGANRLRLCFENGKNRSSKKGTCLNRCALSSGRSDHHPPNSIEHQRVLLPLEPHHISAKFDNETLHLAYVKLPPSFQKIQIVALGYQIEKDHILSALLQQILTTVDLGKDLLVGILDQDESVQYLQEEIPGSDYLVLKIFLESCLPGRWRCFIEKENQLRSLSGARKRPTWFSSSRLF